MTEKRVLLSTGYFAPVRYYTWLASGTVVYIEKHEHYSKQSYRNRCVLAGANGLITLSIPIKKYRNPNILITEVQIDNNTSWQKNHLRSIESAYGSAPFFKYYIDDLIPFFSKPFTFLFDFNLQIQKTIMDMAGIRTTVLMTDEYHKIPTAGMDDFRHTIHPKKRMDRPEPDFHPVEYPQVFSDKHGFLSGLSILDLLFNTGPDAFTYLKKNRM